MIDAVPAGDSGSHPESRGAERAWQSIATSAVTSPCEHETAAVLRRLPVAHQRENDRATARPERFQLDTGRRRRHCLGLNVVKLRMVCNMAIASGLLGM